MKYANFIAVFYCLLISCSTKYVFPTVEIQTKLGNIDVELYPEKAPKSVAAFLSYVDSGYYKNASFYRILNDDNQPSDADKSELIQGGIWKTNYALSPKLPGIPHESTKQTGILNRNGTISLARQAAGTANTEFFICIGDQPGLDYGGANNTDRLGYAAFGKVIKGMDVLKSIYDAPENEQEFTPQIVIYTIKRL